MAIDRSCHMGHPDANGGMALVIVYRYYKQYILYSYNLRYVKYVFIT